MISACQQNPKMVTKNGRRRFFVSYRFDIIGWGWTRENPGTSTGTGLTFPCPFQLLMGQFCAINSPLLSLMKVGPWPTFFYGRRKGF